MMRNLIWITAPSGAGKTIVLNELSKYFSGSRLFTDAAEMIALNKADTEHLYHIQPFNDERFILTSTYHFDQAVKNLCDIMATVPKDEIVFIELARGTGDSQTVDPSYVRLLSLIPRTIFERSVFIHIKADYLRRTYRNKHRKIAGFEENINEQSFFVPKEAMDAFYRHDDFSVVSNSFPCPVFSIDNNNMSKKELGSQIEVLSTKLKDIMGV